LGRVIAMIDNAWAHTLFPRMELMFVEGDERQNCPRRGLLTEAARGGTGVNAMTGASSSATPTATTRRVSSTSVEAMKNVAASASAFPA